MASIQRTQKRLTERLENNALGITIKRFHINNSVRRRNKKAFAHGLACGLEMRRMQPGQKARETGDELPFRRAERYHFGVGLDVGLQTRMKKRAGNA